MFSTNTQKTQTPAWQHFYACQRTVRQLIIEGKEHTPEYETAKAAMDAAVVKATKSTRA